MPRYAIHFIIESPVLDSAEDLAKAFASDIEDALRSIDNLTLVSFDVTPVSE